MGPRVRRPIKHILSEALRVSMSPRHRAKVRGAKRLRKRHLVGQRPNVGIYPRAQERASMEARPRDLRVLTAPVTRGGDSCFKNVFLACFDFVK